jgi:hypothetical protein
MEAGIIPVIDAELVSIERTVSTAIALPIKEQFAAHDETIRTLLIASTVTITDETDAAQQKQAKPARIALKNARVAVDKTRKELKEDSLRRGQAIDGIAKVYKDACDREEARLESIETYPARMEKERVDRLVSERTALLVSSDADPLLYNLATMSNEAFDALLYNVIEEQYLRAKAAQQAEADRIAQEEAVKQDTARLKADNERLVRENAEANAKAETERLAREQVQREADQRDRDRMQADADRAAAEEKAANAPDAEKILAFAHAVAEIPIPEAVTAQGRKVRISVLARRVEFVLWVNEQAKF